MEQGRHGMLGWRNLDGKYVLCAKEQAMFSIILLKQSEENLKDSQGAVGGKWERTVQCLLWMSQRVLCH